MEILYFVRNYLRYYANHVYQQRIMFIEMINCFCSYFFFQFNLSILSFSHPILSQTIHQMIILLSNEISPFSQGLQTQPPLTAPFTIDAHSHLTPTNPQHYRKHRSSFTYYSTCSLRATPPNKLVSRWCVTSRIAHSLIARPFIVCAAKRYFLTSGMGTRFCGQQTIAYIYIVWNILPTNVIICGVI